MIDKLKRGVEDRVKDIYDLFKKFASAENIKYILDSIQQVSGHGCAESMGPCSA